MNKPPAWRLSAAIFLTGGCATMSPVPIGEPARAGIAFHAEGERGSWAGGIADPASGRPVTVDDPVRIASVSKLVVAIGVMKLVEQARLDLDRDVSDYLAWPLRNPHFPDRPITLRQLLSHRSSLRDGDDAYVIPLGETLRDGLAQAEPWDADHGPGDYFAYANFNFPVIGSVIEKVTGERFDLWMRREVLDPIGVDACFNWPSCSDEAITHAVVLTSEGKAIRDDLAGRRPDCPVVPDKDGGCDLGTWRAGENGALFSPQGGLRISARGLARIGQMLLGGGLVGEQRLLAKASVDALFEPGWEFNGRNGSRSGESAGICSYGLGLRHLATKRGCADDPGGNGIPWSGHAGDAYGLRSGLWLDRKRNIGVAYFVTGLPDAAPPGRSSFTAAEEEAFRRTILLFR